MDVVRLHPREVRDAVALPAVEADVRAILAHLALQVVRERLTALADWEGEALEEALRSLAEESGLKMRDLCALVRAAITGKTVGLPLFETMAILGRELCLRRIEKALRWQASCMVREGRSQ